MTTQETISKLAGRDDLSQSELIALRDARRAEKPETETMTVGEWEVSIAHHINEHGDYYHASARASDYRGRELAQGTRDECLAAIEKFRASI